MRTALYNSRPCLVLRKNSDGTSLVSFPPPRREAASEGSLVQSVSDAFPDVKVAVVSGDRLATVPPSNAPLVRGQLLLTVTLLNDEGRSFEVQTQATVPTKQLVRTTAKPNPPQPFIDPAERMRLESFRSDRGRFCRDEKGRAVYH